MYHTALSLPCKNMYSLVGTIIDLYLDNLVEVLIFKQAIALGWDCPRAQILVLFREWHSPIFSIQTVGRIMRMPEPDIGHYKNDILNYGYVYTNLEHIDIQEDMARKYITTNNSHIKKIYKPINLLSCHSVRHREETRLTPKFITIFLREAKHYELHKKIDQKSRQIDVGIISDKKAEDVDALIGTSIRANKDVQATSEDLQKVFDFFVREHLRPFYPEDRSVGRVKEAIYHFFAKDLAIYYQEEQDKIIQIALGNANVQHFINVLEKAKAQYQIEVSGREAELALDEDWNIPPTETFDEDYIRDDKSKSIMEPFYSKGEWKSEKHFIEFLNKAGKVEWWFKNGDRDATYFAVPYKEDTQPKPFYVDFIVKMKDGRIGLFDTKSGITLKVAKPKAGGLYNYIQSENKKGKKLFGGIVTNSDTKDYQGSWLYSDKPIEKWREDLSNWETLEL